MGVMLGTETIHIADTFKSVREIGKQLDRTNIKILSAMWKFGPRNLLEISRRTGIPFTSVYYRVAKLEAKSGRVAYLIPHVSKLGMARIVVLATARSGYEERVTAALKIPNFWWSLNPCEGTFTHHSVHAVPVNFLKDFTAYIGHLSKIRFVTRFRIITTGEQYPNFPNFRHYNPHANRWIVPWGQWFEALRKIAPSKTICDPEDYYAVADKKDLVIVKELEKNARTGFSDLAPMLRMTLQGVKHRYDKRLVPNGIVRNFAFDVYPYPIEVSAYHEIMLEFTNNQSMQKFFCLVSELFFVLGTSKVLGQNALLVRTCILESQVQNMFAFFSEMAKAGMLGAFSSVRMSFTGRETQTISYELFDDKRGWTFDLRGCLTELRRPARGQGPKRAPTAYSA